MFSGGIPNFLAALFRELIDRLAHAPDRQFVAIPLGNAPIGLHRHRDRTRKRVGKLLDDIRLGECLVHFAPFKQRLDDARARFAINRKRQVRRIRRRSLLQVRRERKNFILRTDCLNGILSLILGVRRHDGHNFALKEEFCGKGIGLRRIRCRQDVGHAGHLLRFRNIQRLHPSPRVGTSEQLHPKHVGEIDASGVLGFARKPRDPHFRHGRMRLADDIQIFRRVALPLPGNELLVAFHQRVFRTMSPAGREVPHHRLLDDDASLRLGYDLLFGRRLVAHAISASPRSTLPVSTTVRMIAA